MDNLIGQRVRIHDPHSAFDKKLGEVKEERPPPLPYGVQLDGEDARHGLIWCAYQELDWPV